MDFSPLELALIKGIVKRVKTTTAKSKRDTAAWLIKAQHEAKRLSTEIAKLDGVRRVIHFGSSASGRNFRLDSDIDLAIEGGDVLEAMKVAESSAFRVEIVDIAMVPEPLRELMLQEGIIIHANTR
jgi:predicted nucleotidyltransferase